MMSLSGPVQSVGGSAIAFPSFPSTSTLGSAHSETPPIPTSSAHSRASSNRRPRPFPTPAPDLNEGYHPKNVHFQRIYPERTLPERIINPARASTSTDPGDISETFDVTESYRETTESARIGFKPDLATGCAALSRQGDNAGGNLYGTFRTSEGLLYNSTRRRGALYCRSGSWLEIVDESTVRGRGAPHRISNRQVRGNTDDGGKFTLLEFISVAIGLVSIRGIAADRFLCMDKTNSRLYAAPPSNYSPECVFLEEMLENYYNLYSSCAHYPTNRNNTFKPWYVALRWNGRPRPGKSSRKRLKSSHFLVIHYDDAVPRYDASSLVTQSNVHNSRGHRLKLHNDWSELAKRRKPPDILDPTLKNRIPTEETGEGEKAEAKERRQQSRGFRLKKEREMRKFRRKRLEEKRKQEAEDNKLRIQNARKRPYKHRPVRYSGSRRSTVIPPRLLQRNPR